MPGYFSSTSGFAGRSVRRAPWAAWTLLALAPAFAGCPPADPPVADSGTGLVLDLDAGGEPEPDAGTEPTEDGGEREDSGVAPIDEGEMASRLCEIAARAQHLLATAQEGARCSPGDNLDDPAVTGVELTLGTTCLPGASLYDQVYDVVTGGRVAIDMEALEACVESAREVRAAHATLADLDARSSALEALLDAPECAQAFTPQQGQGDSCTSSFECTGELTCQASPPDGPSTTCLPPAELNQSCADGVPGRAPIRVCADGLTCFNDLCVQRRGEGQVCGPAEVACRDDLTCGAAGTCQSPIPEGGACVIDADCVAGARCLRAICTLPHDDGEACEAGDPCARPCSECRTQGVDAGSACAPPADLDGPCASTADCAHGLFCDVDGICKGNLSFGQECSPSTPCAEGLTCSRDPGAPVSDGGVADGGVVPPTCRSPAPVGSACADGDIPCAGGSCVNGTCLAGAPGDACVVDGNCLGEDICVESVCQVPPRQAAPCAADGRCAAGLYCDGTRCQNYPSAGEPCGPGNRCDSHAYCDADLMCAAKRAAGGMCSADAECASGACLLSGTCGATSASCGGGDEALTWFLLFGGLAPLGLIRLRRRLAAEGGRS